MRSTMRFLLALMCLWWLESSFAFVAGVTESIALITPKDTHTSPYAAADPPPVQLEQEEEDAQAASYDTTTATTVASSSNNINKPKLWDTTSTTTEGTSTASFVSTLFPTRRNQKPDPSTTSTAAHASRTTTTTTSTTAADDQLPPIDWNTNNLLFFLEKLVILRSSTVTVTTEPPLNQAIIQQMKQFVTTIASLYDAENPYHNFEHATHVSKSLTQLLTQRQPSKQNRREDGLISSNPMDTIRSDPLVTFSLIFAALIHDVDHGGVSNAQLVKESSPLASKYGNQSIAEHHSIDLAMDLLLHDPTMKELRQAIFGGSGTDDDAPSSSLLQQRFEYLVTRAVLATDIADSALKADRQRRWEAVYGTNGITEDTMIVYEGIQMDARTVIAMEHLMQVVDVAHTMQSGPINHQWNERLFAEFKRAHQNKRADKDPIDGWYSNELGFFDYYVIPLARKFEFCCGGAGFLHRPTNSIDDDDDDAAARFVVAEDKEELELLFPTDGSLVDQAKRNRQEWEMIGHGVVAELEEKY